MRKPLAFLLICPLALPVAWAQTPSSSPATSAPTFTAASIKRSTVAPGTPGLGGFQILTGGRVIGRGVTARQLILSAYRLHSDQLKGGPSWLDTERFDILAETDGDRANPMVGMVEADTKHPAPLEVRMRALLADRFNLATHDENSELPIYALVFANASKKLGPKLQPSHVDCTVLVNSGAPRPAPRAADLRPNCAGFIGRPGNVSIGGATIAQLSRYLSNQLDRMVVDHTGLTGGFDIDLVWTPDATVPRSGAAQEPPIADSGAPSIFTAVQEQLGLKLESTRGPVDVFVIDHVERPTED